MDFTNIAYGATRLSSLVNEIDYSVVTIDGTTIAGLGGFPCSAIKGDEITGLAPHELSKVEFQRPYHLH